MQVPHCNVAITTAAKADLGVWTNCKSIAGRCAASQFSLNSRCRLKGDKVDALKASEDGGVNRNTG